MSQFVFLALLFGLIGAAFVVSTLWQSSRKLAIALAVALPVGAGLIYHFKGTPEALDPAVVRAPTTIPETIEYLQHRLASRPDDHESLVLLARTYMAAEQFENARDAYAKAVAQAPGDVDLPVEYAEAQMRTTPDHRFPPAAVAMLETAVAKNPQNQRALFFLGMHRMQSGDAAAAATTWEKLLPMLSPEAGGILRQQINAARATAKLPPLPEPAAAPGVAIRLDVDPTLAGAVHPGDVVFVFARSAQGPDAGPPLAVQRVTVDAFPMSLRLTDADSPMSTAKLSGQHAVRIQARLSRSGSVEAGSGDIEADPIEATVGADAPVTVRLTRVRP